jgi:hypothetical protein
MEATHVLKPIKFSILVTTIQFNPNAFETLRNEIKKGREQINDVIKVGDLPDREHYYF